MSKSECQDYRFTQDKLLQTKQKLDEIFTCSLCTIIRKIIVKYQQSFRPLIILDNQIELLIK